MKTLPLAALAVVLASPLASPAFAQGLYVNPFAGMVVVDSTITVGEQKLVDQGGDMLAAGVRGGWGVRRPSGLYLGAEVEAWGASGRSRACVNGQCFSYALDGGVGAFARVGWQTEGRALFFVRGGTQALFSNQGTQWAPAVGIGAEVPFAPRWRARLDVTYAWTSQDRREFTQVSVGVVREFSW